MGVDGGVDVPARAGEPLVDSDADVLHALLFETAVLKAAAKPPFVLRALGSADWGDGVGVAAGVPGAGLTWSAPVIGLDGSSLVGSDRWAGARERGVGLCGQ